MIDGRFCPSLISIGRIAGSTQGMDVRKEYNSQTGRYHYNMHFVVAVSFGGTDIIARIESPDGVRDLSFSILQAESFESESSMLQFASKQRLSTRITR